MKPAETAEIEQLVRQTIGKIAPEADIESLLTRNK